MNAPETVIPDGLPYPPSKASTPPYSSNPTPPLISLFPAQAARNTLSLNLRLGLKEQNKILTESEAFVDDGSGC